MDFPAHKKFVRANRYFASFACTSPIRCEVPTRLLWVFYVACVPHPRMARESYVLDTDNIRALRGTGVWTAWQMRGSCTQDARERGHIKMKVFLDTGKQFISIGKSKWFPDTAKTFVDLLMSEITDIENYFPISVIISLSREIPVKCTLDVPGSLYWLRLWRSP